MAAMTPEEFYKANIDKEKEYVRIYTAREVKAGESIDRGCYFEDIKEDGYEISKGVGYRNKREFAVQTTPAENMELPLPKKDLDKEYLQNIRPVKKGERFWIDYGGGTLSCSTAAQDGYIITKGKGQLFMSHFELMSQFNYAGKGHETEKELIITMNDETPLTGIILDEDVTFAFKDCTQSARAGSLLFVDPKSEDGYGLQRPILPFNTQLRISAGWTARKQEEESIRNQHDTALKKQEKLKACAPRIRLK